MTRSRIGTRGRSRRFVVLLLFPVACQLGPAVNKSASLLLKYTLISLLPLQRSDPSSGHISVVLSPAQKSGHIYLSAYIAFKPS